MISLPSSPNFWSGCKLIFGTHVAFPLPSVILANDLFIWCCTIMVAWAFSTSGFMPGVLLPNKAALSMKWLVTNSIISGLESINFELHGQILSAPAVVFRMVMTSA